MLGTIVNVVAVSVGGLIGATLGGVIKERYKNTIMQGIALSVMVIGLYMALEGLSASRPDGFRGEMLLVMIFSLLIGAVIGEWIDIEARLEQFGHWIQKVIHRGSGVSTFAEGFVIASLVYCVGSMAIMGSIQDGLNNDPSILYAKSILDGVSAIIFSSTLGFGVAFSFIPIFIYQGAITILASFVKPLLIDWVIIEMSAVGGILIMGIGLTMLEIKKINVGNLLPSIFIPVLYGIIVTFIF